MFPRLSDAVMRINQSVVHYKNRPVYIQKTYCDADDLKEEDIFVDILDLLDQEEMFKVKLNKDDFNFKAFQIGYVNSEELGAMYIERKAVRRVKEGLSHYNVDLRYLPDDRGNRQLVPEDLLISDNLGVAIMDIYPDIDDVLQDVRASKESFAIAFNRAFAYRKGDLDIIYLDYKNTSIGWVNEDTNKVRLASRYSYMQQELTFKGIDNYAP